MTSIIGVGLANGNQAWAERALSAFGNNDPMCVRKICSKATGHSELKTARPRACFCTPLLSWAYFIRYRGERFPSQAGAAGMIFFPAKAYTHEAFAQFAGRETGDCQRIQAITKRDNGRLVIAEAKHPLTGLRNGVLPLVNSDLPAITGQEVQRIMQRSDNVILSPMYRVMYRNTKLNLSAPSLLWTTLGSVAKFHGSGQEECVIQN